MATIDLDSRFSVGTRIRSFVGFYKEKLAQSSANTAVMAPPRAPPFLVTEIV